MIFVRIMILLPTTAILFCVAPIEANLYMIAYSAIILIAMEAMARHASIIRHHFFIEYDSFASSPVNENNIMAITSTRITFTIMSMERSIFGEIPLTAIIIRYTVRTINAAGAHILATSGVMDLTVSGLITVICVAKSGISIIRGNINFGALSSSIVIFESENSSTDTIISNPQANIRRTDKTKTSAKNFRKEILPTVSLIFLPK